MKIAQTCQGDTLANLDQEGPNVKKQQKYVMQTQLHGTTFRRLDCSGIPTVILQGAASQHCRILVPEEGHSSLLLGF